MLFSWWAATQGACTSDSLFVHLCRAKLIPPSRSLFLSLHHTHTCTLHAITTLYLSQRECFQIKWYEWNIPCLVLCQDIIWYHVNTRPAGMFGLSRRGMPFSWGLGRDVASIGLPSEQSQSSHVNFSRSRRTSATFQLWRWTENTITGTLLNGKKGGKKIRYHYNYLFAKIKEASYRGVPGWTSKDRYICLIWARTELPALK